MLALGDFDLYLAGKTDKFAGTRIRHDDYAELRHSTCHGAAMVQRKAAAEAIQRASYTLNGDIDARDFDLGHHAPHLAFAGGLERAVKALVERNPRDPCAFGFCIVRLLRSQLHVKLSTYHSHAVTFCDRDVKLGVSLETLRWPRPKSFWSFC